MFDEHDMRRALGLPELRVDEGVQLPAKPHKIRVELSVRAPWGGPTRKFTHEAKTLSSLEATIEAQRKAREAGLTVWCVLRVDAVAGE